MPQRLRLSDLMDSSGVGFGTSGARGRVQDMTDRICYGITAAFLRYVDSPGSGLRAVGDASALPSSKSVGNGGHPEAVAIAGDLRSSTPRIMRAVATAVEDAGRLPVNCGRIPSPALALWGLHQNIPSIMVTGSHIPDDRNGIKYNTSRGEILKRDEQTIRRQEIELPDIFDDAGNFVRRMKRHGAGKDWLDQADDAARRHYVHRWLSAFSPSCLKGLRLGLYQHSSVGRDILLEVYSRLGAEVTCFGRSDAFVPVDTEAIRSEDVALARAQAHENGFDAIVSTDGDSDRPLLSDEHGNWLRGDVAGILCARYFNARAVATPVSCNSAVERCGWFESVRRTRIGSPYVIEAMLEALDDGEGPVVGYEANGGFLTATPLHAPAGWLSPLPTRDAVIVHLAVLGLARREGRAVSGLARSLPARFTASDRLKSFPREISLHRIAGLLDAGAPAMEAAFPALGALDATDNTDGLRMTFAGGDVLHLRPSGNAPELRCYTEAGTQARANALTRMGLEVLRGWRDLNRESS